MDVVGRIHRGLMHRVVLAGLALVLVSACGTVSFTPDPLPTEAEATAFVGRLAQLARTGDFSGLCALGSGNCERVLREVGEDSAPTADPTILGAQVIKSRKAEGDTWSIGGVVLRVCGTDGLGRPYQSEVLVFSGQGTLHAIEAVFWAGGRVADDGTVGGWDDPPLASNCPSPSP
jgi:hypothetical protein